MRGIVRGSISLLVGAAVGFTLAARAADEAEPAPSLSEPVLMVGDSMMRMLAISLEKELTRNNFKAASFSSIGSGLNRLDVFDWFGKVEELLAEHKPGTVIAVFGANDRQALLNDAGVVVNYGSPEWDEAYRGRVARMMKTILDAGTERIIWMMLPDMRQDTQQQYAEHFNKLLVEAGAEFEKVELFDPRHALRRRGRAEYAATLITPDGCALQVRSPDGIHLSRAGADLVAETIVEKYK